MITNRIDLGVSYPVFVPRESAAVGNQNQELIFLRGSFFGIKDITSDLNTGLNVAAFTPVFLLPSGFAYNKRIMNAVICVLDVLKLSVFSFFRV